ncbi:MAG TPA: glycosyltransferase 87 family protein [Gaiellaceae bacterium]|nr:glycosyltransferase 87 family protein [Gaiellaceae bacterium]
MTLRAWIALAAAAACAFLGSWVVLGHLWYHSTGQIVDTPGYEQYGDAMVAGQVPYRDFAVEYPPGALLPFIAPELTARKGDYNGYTHAFERWMAGAGVLLTLFAAAALAALRAPPLRAVFALALIAVSPLLLGTVVLTRFDLWPAALTAAVVAALLLGRNELGALALGAAIATKLYPIVLVPLGIAWVWRIHGRQRALAWTALVAATCAAVFIPFAAIAPGGLGHSFGVQLHRPLQIESLGAATLIALHHVAGIGLILRTDHGSQNIESAGAGTLSVLTTVVAFAVLCAIWFLFARGPAEPERLATAAAASVATFMAFGKVFSPQFMIWLIPLVPLVRSRVAPVLLATALVLTQRWFPAHYWALTRYAPLESWTLFARDVALVALVGVLLAGLSPAGPAGRTRGWRAARRAAA